MYNLPKKLEEGEQRPLPTLALIDGDILRYSLGSITNKQTILGKEIDVPLSDKQVEELVNGKISDILRAVNCTEYFVYLSEGRTFRNDVATIQSYKGNREESTKPVNWKLVDYILKNNHPIDKATYYEADDHLSMRQSEDYTTVICTKDKDLRMVAGWHYGWQNGEYQKETPLHWKEEYEGFRWFLTQLLTGDSIDNIRGCAVLIPCTRSKSGTRRKGIGKKTAEKLLEPVDTALESLQIVEQTYKDIIGITGEDWKKQLIENSVLLWMVRDDKQLPTYEYLYKIAKEIDNDRIRS
jgi:5'-3' exonuclease